MTRNVALFVTVWCLTAGLHVVTSQTRGGRGGDPEAGATATRPPLLLTETWKEPQAARPLPIEDRWVSKVPVVSHPDLELRTYGPDAKTVSVNPHEGRLDLWNGDTASPVAITLRHRSSYLDLRGLARVRWIVRTQGLHSVHPVLKLADGTLVAGSNRDETDGVFLQREIAFTNQIWYRLDPEKVTTGPTVQNPDLSKVDEIGWVDLAPGGGRGSAGWFNMSTVEVYTRAVPR